MHVTNRIPHQFLEQPDEDNMNYGNLFWKDNFQRKLNGTSREGRGKIYSPHLVKALGDQKTSKMGRYDMKWINI